MGEVIRHITQEQKNTVRDIPIYPLEVSAQEDYSTAEQLSAQKVESRVDFNLKKDANINGMLEDAKKVKQTVKDAEEEKRAEENMKTWRMQLSTVESETEKIKIAMEFEIDILIKALTKNVERVDDIYLMFCKKEDRKPMHSDALKKIREDMESEYDEITPYIREAEDFKKKMM